MTLTFIIPVYNVESNLLRRCFDSLCALAYKHWIAVVIDDGSTTVDVQGLVDALHDDRFLVYRQPNGGLSVARNTGLDITADDYIMFLDADDYIFAPVVDSLIALLDERRPDVLAFNMQKVYDEGVAAAPQRALHITYEGTGRDYMTHHNVRAAAWGYIFKRTLSYRLRFTPGIVHEDEEFTPHLWVKSTRFIDTTAVAYAYYQRPHSIMHSTDAAAFARRLDDIRGIIRRLRSTGDKALQRRAKILRRDMVYNILRHSPSVAFALKQLRHV